MSVTQIKTAKLVGDINALQEIQKRNSPKTTKWQKASEFLAPMFAEMARRQKVNGNEGDWQRWAS